MYRVSYNKLLEILERGECRVASTKLESLRINGNLETMGVIEVNYTIDDKGTEHEVLTVTEFNIYCENIVYFGTMFKHEADFTIDSARTTPYESYLVLTGDVEVAMPNIDKNTKEKLNFLTERALDYYEHTDTNEEREQGYKECDEASAVIAETLRNTTNQLQMTKGKLRDLSRVIEKMGEGEDLDIITKQIDEINEQLNEIPRSK